MVEFLAKENSAAFENKRLHTGYTNIKKLLSLVRQQYLTQDGIRSEHPNATRYRRRTKEERIMNEAVRDALLIAGQMGFDTADIRIIFPALREISDEAIEKCLQHGQVLHRLNISAKLYDIIESPDTLPKELIAAERHLREVHTKTAQQAGSITLLNLLRGTVPMMPSENDEEEGGDDDNVE